MHCSARPRPGFIEAFVAATSMVIVAWCLISNHEIACVAVALALPLLLPGLLSIRPQGSGSDLTMGFMTGGTAGGLIGGVGVRILCAPASMTPIMMASMAGMVGGALAGWSREG